MIVVAVAAALVVDTPLLYILGRGVALDVGCKSLAFAQTVGVPTGQTVGDFGVGLGQSWGFYLACNCADLVKAGEPLQTLG